MAAILLSCCVALLALPAGAGGVAQARYDAPTTRYAHGVLGDAVEYGALVLTLDDGSERRITLPGTRVFEDVAPRLIRDGDGRVLAMVVESSLAKGARVALYDADGLRAATPHIGRPHRWLAPVGAADLDGDGRIEVAYVDRPHLAMRLRVWRLAGGRLVHVADKGGLSNHRIGWDFIPGGIRQCSAAPEMVTATADWSAIVASTLREGRIATRRIGTYDGSASLDAALSCP
ncbi:VCBS repeat-containing protein [Sediminimonas sp.]|uniref:FG-GAP repeat domain-containing protein n=1 Tax=Sediminimonas sp. TaxID=2823379 RepID=UPI0025FC57C5|nr:VCBS repeat-containing protein [Sediminimonas sp.]